MTTKINIATGLEFPVEIAGRRTAIFGISGSGKSNTATVLIKQLLHAGEQIVLVDPKGEGWGLLSAAAGQPSKLPIIVFGEPNGHIETLSDTHGPRLADFVVDTGRSVVLSLLGFESDQSERRFVSTFLRQLYRRKSRQGQPTRTLVVLDEAHLFVPENVRGDAAELAGAAQRIARQGRTFGIGTLIVDQRPQDVSKRVITQCDTLICHQLVHKTDRDALRDWVRGYDVDGRGEQFLESVAQLEPGEAWVWSPAWLKVFQRTKVHRRRTFDSGAAPDGSAAARTVHRAKVDLDELKTQLAEVFDRAKADDPKELRKRIADLERQMRDRPAETVTVDRVVEVPVLANGQLVEARELVGRLEGAVKETSACARQIAETIARAVMPAPRPLVRTPPTARPVQPQHVPRPVPTLPGEVLPKAERLILTALAQHGPCAKPKVAILAGYAFGNGGFNNSMSSLRTKGFIDGHDPVQITDTGLAALGDYQPLPTGPALLEHWARQLGKAECMILRALTSVYPRPMTKEQLGAAAGYEPAGGGFNNALSKLRTLELIEGRGELRASDHLF